VFPQLQTSNLVGLSDGARFAVIASEPVAAPMFGAGCAYG